MTRQSTLLLGLMLFCAALNAQKTFRITRIDQEPRINGMADEACWSQATVTGDFSTSSPVFGRKPAHTVSVRMFYTDEALFVSAECEAENLRDDGGARDEMQGDWFSVAFDTWNDDQHAFEFVVTAAGVQTERQIAGPDGEINWDAVWQSAVKRTAIGWSVEMRIPFTALRFPKNEVQNWGVQFSRLDARNGERCTWNPQNPLVYDVVLQFGALEGLEQIHQAQRRRLFALSDNSYSTIPNRFLGGAGVQRTLALRGGLDGQVGIGSNATLDFSILPVAKAEFGNNPLNNFSLQGEKKLLTPRQLNSESALLLNRGGLDGALPEVQVDYMTSRLDNDGKYYLIREKQDAHALNTTRFSMRTRGNIGIGVSNTIYGPAGLVLYDTASHTNLAKTLQSASNFTVLAVEKVLRNNSWINFSNATLLAGPLYRSNISSADIRLRDRSNKYEIAANGQLAFYETRPDTATYTGQYRASVAKVNGAWLWRAGFETRSYTAEDLKNAVYPQYNYDERRLYQYATLQYRDVTPGKHYLNRSASLLLSARSLNPANLNLSVSVLTPRFYRWNLQISSDLEGRTERYGTGGTNVLLRKVSPVVSGYVGFDTDTRKRLSLSFINNSSVNTGGETMNTVFLFTPTWVVNRHFSLSFSNMVHYGARFINYINDNSPEYLFVQFNSISEQHKIQINWYAGSRFRMWVEGQFNKLGYLDQHVVRLTTDRKLEPFDFPFTKYGDNKAYNAAFGLQYWFKPGSQLRFSHTVKGYQNLYFPTSPLVLSKDDFLKENQTTLSLILLIDPPNKRNFVGHE